MVTTPPVRYAPKREIIPIPTGNIYSHEYVTPFEVAVENVISIARPLITQSDYRQDSLEIPGKKAAAVESYFNNRVLTNADEQLILRTIRDFDKCADQQCSNDQLKALCFFNVLVGQSQKFFCANINECTTF